MSKISEKILRDAELEAERAVERANATASERLLRATADAEAEANAVAERAKRNAEAAAKQSEIATKSRVSRETLAQKQAYIDKVFATVREQIIKGKDISGALEKKFAKPGDAVVKKDGGIVIDNANYSLSLTVDDLLTELRHRVEADVAKILFS